MLSYTSKGECMYILKLTLHSEVDHNNQYFTCIFFFLDEEFYLSVLFIDNQCTVLI